MKRTGWILAVVVAALAAYMMAGRSQEKPAVVSADAPAPGTVVVMPAEAYENSTLSIQLAGDRRAKLEPVSCRWFVNGTEVADATAPTLAPGSFRKGDEVEAEVVLSAGASPVRSAALRILNTRPRLVAASANLRTEPSAELYVEVSAIDADDDPVSYTYQWFRNGKEMPGETGATLAVSKLKMGDAAHAMVTASDGTESSAAQKSDPIEIGSNAPDITSTPPTSLEPGRRFVYQVTTSSHDPRSLRFELVDAPAGMTMDSDGLIEWTVPDASEESANYAVSIRVSDPTGGEAVQRFRVSSDVQRSSSAE